MKKEYFTPEITVVKLPKQAILAGSGEMTIDSEKDTETEGFNFQ